MLQDTIEALCDCTPETRVTHHPGDDRALFLAHRMNDLHGLHLVISADPLTEIGTLVITDRRGRVQMLSIETDQCAVSDPTA
jgi:hypothetical protein